MYVTLSADTDARVGGHANGHSERSTAPVSNRMRCSEGTHLYREGDEATRLYEVVSGVLRLTRVLENGRRQVIAFGLPGDIVGFPNDNLHHTDCDVLADAEIITYRRQVFEAGESDPETHRRLLRAALREISAMQDHFMMLARKSAMERIALFLIALARRNGQSVGNTVSFSLPMSRGDIADFLAMTVETVSRSISMLRTSGIVALTTPQSVRVLDMDALLDVSLGGD